MQPWFLHMLVMVQGAVFEWCVGSGALFYWLIVSCQKFYSGARSLLLFSVWVDDTRVMRPGATLGRTVGQACNFYTNGARGSDGDDWGFGAGIRRKSNHSVGLRFSHTPVVAQRAFAGRVDRRHDIAGPDGLPRRGCGYPRRRCRYRGFAKR